MQYAALGNKPNISESRFECVSPSFKLDSRGFAHISYLEKKQGHNNVNYSFWDGLQWGYNDIPFVYSSQENVIYSPNSLILDSNDMPVIVFSKKIADGCKLFLSTYDGNWSFNTLDVNYNVGWIGVVKKGDIGPSSSSSFSSSSSPISSLSSNVGYEYYVVLYDSSNSEFKIYSVGDNWILLKSIHYSLGDFESVRIDALGSKIGIAFIDNGIKYKIIDISEIDSFSSSSNSSLSSNSSSSGNSSNSGNSSDSSGFNFNTVPSSLLYGAIIDMDIKGYFYGGLSIMAFGWISSSASTSYVCSVLIDDTDTETPSDGVSAVVESKTINVTTTGGYSVNSYNTIGISLDSSFYIHMFASGVKSRLFDLGITGWTSTDIEINGISDGIVLDQLRCEYYDTSKIVAVDNGNIYYFDYKVSFNPLTIATPDIVVSSSGYAYKSFYTSGSLSGDLVDDAWNNFAFKILNDQERPLIIFSNQAIPPITTTTTTTPSPFTTTTTSLGVGYYASGFGFSATNGCYVGPEANPGFPPATAFYRNTNTTPGDLYGNWLVGGGGNWFLISNYIQEYNCFSALPTNGGLPWSGTSGPAPYGIVSLGCP